MKSEAFVNHCEQKRGFNMQKILLKIIGYLHIVLALCYMIAVIIIIPFIEGTIVFPELFQRLVYCILFVLSGVGIILQRKKLFMLTFYPYTFLILDRIVNMYSILKAEKVGPYLDKLYAAIYSELIITILILCFYFSVILFMVKREILVHFQIYNKKEIGRQLLIALIIYFIFLVIK